jgi:hypothetical protein
MANQLDREINRLSNLKNYKDIEPNELEIIARRNIEVRDFKKNPLFSNDKEQILAETRFRNYLENNEIESVSDIDTLKSLVYNEIFEQRIQGELNKLADENKYPPEKLTKQLTDVQNQKLSLKVKLGIDKKDEERDELSAYQLLQKRVIKYINDHKDEFTIGLGFDCERCNHKNWESFLIYKQVKDFKVLKHPYFAGRFLFNYEIIKDVKDKKLSKEDAWRYLLCSGEGKFYKPGSEDKKYCIDYINYCLENWTEITDLIKKN